MKTLIVVAQRDGARLYEWTTRAEPLRLIEELAHPEGRLREGDLDTDRSGASYESSASGASSAAAGSVSATAHLAVVFAHRVADRTDHALADHAFDRLVLVSGPRFLGLLRDELSNSTRALKRHEIVKNLGHASARELKAHIEPELLFAAHA